MQKLILTILIFITFGCNHDQSISLSSDPIVNEYFNSEEVKNLSKILKFFETQITDSLENNSIKNSYARFFENLEPAMKQDEININISFEYQNRLFEEIDSSLFKEIWYYRKDFHPILKDTIRSIHYNWKGKYFNFLHAVSEKDTSFESYFEDFTLGDISPSLLAYSMMNNNTYNLDLDRTRLIVAINFLTFNEQLRLEEKYNTK
jgi:hypothetical protein